MTGAWYRCAGLALHGRGLTACGESTSDRSVFGEMFGSEDAYRLDVVLPLMRGGTVVAVGAHEGCSSILAGSVAERACLALFRRAA